MPTDIQVVGRVIVPQERVAVAFMYWKLYFSPCGKSSLIGTCHATISYRLPFGFSSSSRYTTVAGIVLLCWDTTPTEVKLIVGAESHQTDSDSHPLVGVFSLTGAYRTDLFLDDFGDIQRRLTVLLDTSVAAVPPAPGNHEGGRGVRRQRAVGVEPRTAPGLDALRRVDLHEQRLEVTAPRGRQPEYLVGTDGAEFVELLEKQDSDVRDARSVSKGGRWCESRRR